MKKKGKRSRYWHLRTAVLIFGGLIVLGTLLYKLIVPMTWWGALYQTVITVSTVGYGHIWPKDSVSGEVISVVLIVCGLATVVYFTTSVVELILEGRILEMMGRRKVLKELQDVSGHYIICGFGRVGRQIARECIGRGSSVVVIEQDDAISEQCMNEGFLVVKGDATEERVLREAGLERAHGLVTALSSDADNLFVTMTARIIRPDVFIVGRCNTDETEAKLYRAGVDRAISPHNVGGRHMAALLLKPLICDFLDVVTHGELVELTLEDLSVETGSALIGRSLRDILVGDLKGIGVLGLKRPKRDFLVNPRGDTVLDAGDILILAGTPEKISHLKELAGPRS